LCLSTCAALGSEPFTGFFTRTPAVQMREMSTDRPDQTESPYSVDAGHFQLEMDILTYTRDAQDGVTTSIWNLAPVNLKLGLGHNTDLQVILEGWSREEEKTALGRVQRSGLGDLTLRWKQNLWGNDSGATALAVMPFVTLPLRASELGRERPEAGVAVPFGWNLPHGLYLGLMTEWDWLTSGDGGGHTNVWFNTATLGFDITERLGGYVEVTAAWFDDGTPWAGTVDGGITFALTENVQLDVGCNFGVTESAPDVQPFLGLTYRY
jgi:hypothetical protein